jgi:hypothetical protein
MFLIIDISFVLIVGVKMKWRSIMDNENTVKLTDDVVYAKDAACCKISVPKRVATIKLCGGAVTFYIDDTMNWQRPTDEQIYNLKNLFCIEVIPED